MSDLAEAQRPNMDAEDVVHINAVTYWMSRLPADLQREGVMTRVCGSNKPLADEVFDHIAGKMTTAECVLLGRAWLRKDKEAVFQIVGKLVHGVIKDYAEEMAEDTQ